MIHLAGPALQITTRVRQRCAWCGAAIVDQDLTLIARPTAEAATPFPIWPEGALVLCEVGGSRLVEHPGPGQALPTDTCAALDPEAPR